MLNINFLFSLFCVIQLNSASAMTLKHKETTSAEPFGQIRIRNANATEIKKILDIVLDKSNSKLKRVIYTPKDALKDLTESDYYDETTTKPSTNEERADSESTVTTSTLSSSLTTTTEKQEQDLFAYLFKIESNDEEQSSKNVLFSKENIGSGLQYVDNEKVAPKVNTKILAKLFEILNKNFLDGVNRADLVHKTHDFYDSFYNTCNI